MSTESEPKANRSILCRIFHDQRWVGYCVMRDRWYAITVPIGIALVLTALVYPVIWLNQKNCTAIGQEAGIEPKWRWEHGCFVDPDGDGVFIPVSTWRNTQEVQR